MSSLEDPEHIHGASEDSEQVTLTVPDHLSLGPLLGHTLVERIPKGLSAFDSRDDVRMAFENFKRVVSPDDFSELTCATLDGSSTDSLTTQDPCENPEFIFATLGNFSKNHWHQFAVTHNVLPFSWAPARLFLELSIP
ncbi:hypothetical protein V2G26_003498 [Clonostachys chloroleuca]